MKKIVCIVLTICCCHSSMAGSRDSIKVGVFITNLYDFNIAGKSFKADFWIWYLHKNDSLKTLGTCELPQSKSSSFSYDYFRKRTNASDENFSNQKCKAEIIKDWNVTNFPFDKQSLQIKIESSLEQSDITLLPDSLNSSIDSSLFMEDWQVKKFKLTNGTTVYNTNYGDPNIKMAASKYSYINATVDLSRKSPYMIFFKLLTVLFASFIIICSAFFLEPDNTTRFGVATGSLFAAVSNKNFAASVAPSSNGNTLMDTIHNFTFLCFILVIGMALYTYWLAKNEQKERAKKIGQVFIFSLLIIYTLIIGFMVYKAKTVS
ncbi:hypothetical protein ACFOWM_07850 [Ferruginibacter yonginensis]|uniref:Uncharacterized protein n=1 Tax=Ferruginibacter yonginensis TaxID=1310416 RepID=A0ABV8QV30_9BACT